MCKVSVIVPVYNTEQYLPRCIDSILNQSFTDFELLLIDDGSTDGSGKICDEYAKKDSRIRVFHKENGGVSSARNVGLDKANGEWICFVDSDDELLPGGLQAMVNGISEEVDVVMAGYYELDGDTLRIDTTCFGGSGIIDQNKALLMMYPSEDMPYMGYPVGKLFKRNLIFGRTISFDEHIRIKEDTLFVVTFLCESKKPIYFTSVPVYRYLKNTSGTMNSLKVSYNPHYLDSFDAVFEMNRRIQWLPELDKRLSKCAKYAVIVRYHMVYAYMLHFDAVDKTILSALRKKVIKEVGFRYELYYQFHRNNRRIKRLMYRIMNDK